MFYSVYDSASSSKELVDRNALFMALVIVGASRSDEVLDCLTVNERYTELQKRYNIYKDSLGICNRGIKYICALLQDKNIPIRKRKCMNYVYTKKGKWFYTDNSITLFAKALLQTINTDEAMLKLFKEKLDQECANFANNTIASLEDCVQHLFGFQYEGLSRIVAERKYPNSKKSIALKRCLSSMDSVVQFAGYPGCKTK